MGIDDHLEATYEDRYPDSNSPEWDEEPEDPDTGCITKPICPHH